MNHGLPAELDSLRAFLPELVTQAMERVPNACALVTQSGGESAVKAPSAEQVNPIPPGPGIRYSQATSQLLDRDYPVRATRELAESISLKPGPSVVFVGGLQVAG